MLQPLAAVCLLLPLIVLPGTEGAFRDGEFIQTARRAQFHEARWDLALLLLRLLLFPAEAVCRRAFRGLLLGSLYGTIF